MIPLFDYGSIKEEHKEAAEECAKFLEERGLNMFSSEIRERFKLVAPKRFPVEDSEFYTTIKQFGITPSVQGFAVDPNGVHIPLIAVCAEVTKFDEFLQYYKNLSSE